MNRFRSTLKNKNKKYTLRAKMGEKRGVKLDGTEKLNCIKL